MKLNCVNQNLNINFHRNQENITNKEIININSIYKKEHTADVFTGQKQDKPDISTKNSEEKSKNLKRLLIFAGITTASGIAFFVLKSKKHTSISLDDSFLSPFFRKRVKKLREIGTKDVDNEFMQKQCEKYTDNELRNIVKPYLQDSLPYNEVLRNELNNKNILEKIAQIDKLIEKAKPLKKDSVVYRAIDGSAAEQFISDLCNNKLVTDRGYMSTGTNLTTSEFKYYAEKENSFILRILLPKGTKGLYPSVSEIVLPRNSHLKLVSFDKELKIIDCEYILPKN